VHKSLNRTVVAQSILNQLGGGSYLEIGVDTGNNFIHINADPKWGVDPAFTLTKRRLLKYQVFAYLGLKVEKLFRMTSDEFFYSQKPMLAADGISVCLVDGLHTYDQSLRDVLNALTYLKPNGVILMHDCNPATELMAAPATSIEDLIRQGIQDWDGSWSGDVWKAVINLRSLQRDVNAFVLDCDTGIGVVTKGTSSMKLNISESEIRQMDFSFLSSRRSELLGLQPPEYFFEFLQEHTAQLR
jgi:hypothetical protein